MAENKIEAVLSFKLDPTGLKDAEKELENLEKQLKDLNEQQVGAGPGKGSPETAQKIADTEKAIKLNKLQQGDPEAAKEFQGALEGKLGGRNPSKTFTDNFENAVSAALKDLFGDVATPQAKQRIVDAMVEAMPTKERPEGNPKAPSEEENEKAKARRAENPLQVQVNPPEEYKPSVTPEALQAAPATATDEGAGQSTRKAVEEGVTEANPAANAVVAEVGAQVQERNEQTQAVEDLPRLQTDREQARRGRGAPRGSNRVAGRYRYDRDEANLAEQTKTIDEFEPKGDDFETARNRPGARRNTTNSRVGARYSDQARTTAREERLESRRAGQGPRTQGVASRARQGYDDQQLADQLDSVEKLPGLVPGDPRYDRLPGMRRAGGRVAARYTNMRRLGPMQTAGGAGAAGATVPDDFLTNGAVRKPVAPEAYTAPAIPGPESFIVNPLDAKAKQAPEAKAAQGLANNMVKGALADQAEIDKNNVKINKAQSDSLAKEVKARKEVAEQAKAAEAAYYGGVNTVKSLQQSLTANPLLKMTPELARGAANQLQQGYTDQQGVLKAATKAGDTSAVADATDKLTSLGKAAQELNQSFTGTAKSSDTFQKSLKTINHAADLQEERTDLKQKMADEPDKDMRRNYAHALNLNTQKLVPLTADPEERRSINKENVQRSKDYGLQSDMMASFGQFLAGNVLMSVGRGARAPFTAANQSFDQFNQQHQVDPALLSAQRGNQAAMLGLGEQFQSYNLFKAGIARQAITSPLAGPASVIGDVAGAIAGPAGAMLQTGASLKMAATDSKAIAGLLSAASGAGILGLSGLAGGAVGLGLGTVLGMPEHRDPFEQLRSFFDPKGLAADKTEGRYAKDLSTMTGPKLQQVSAQVDLAGTAIQDYDKRTEDYDSRQRAKDRKGAFINPYVGPVGDAQSKLDQATDTSDQAMEQSKKSKAEALKNLGDIAEKISQLTNGTGLTDAEKGNADYLKGFVQTFQDSLLKGGSEAVKKFQQIIDSDPSFKLQQKQMNEQRADQQQDFQRSRVQLDRSYSRQQEDFSRTRSRTKEDYNVSEQRLGVSRTRAAEDFTLANQQNDRGYFRTTRDIGTSLQREGEDQTRQRSRQYQDYDRSMGRLVENRDTTTYRLQRDTTKGLDRTTEDVSRSTGRTLEDAARTVQRAQEDGARTWQRSVEDTSRTWQRTTEDANRTLSRAFEDASITLSRAGQDFAKSASRAIDDATTSRSRLSQDYNREVNQQNKSYVRQNQDMDQSYQDSVLGIVAPGLASNPAYQLMKLNRDYTKNKGRAAEDYQQGRTDLNTSTDRSFDDIAKSLKRGLDDMTQSFQRTLDDVAKSLERTTEDVNTTLARTAEDIATTLSRTGEDLATSLARTMEDAATSVSRALEDAATTMQRATEDAATALSDGMIDINKNFSQGVDDLNTSLTRAIQDLDTSDFRARFDAMRSLDDAKIDYDTNRNKLQQDYNRQVEDLNNAEYDLRKDYNRTLEDLNTAQQRAAQDYQTASDGLNIQITRATRDFENASSSFIMSVAQAAGLISSYNQQIANNSANGDGGGGGNTPGLGGLNEIPKDEFPAMLHVGEMVVTRGEAQQLRDAGYRPESKNLDEIIPSLMRGRMPGFEGGYNGMIRPDGHGGDSAHPGPDSGLSSVASGNTGNPGNPYASSANGFSSEAAFLAANPDWTPYTGSKWVADYHQKQQNMLGDMYTPDMNASNTTVSINGQSVPFGTYMDNGVMKFPDTTSPYSMWYDQNGKSKQNPANFYGWGPGPEKWGNGSGSEAGSSSTRHTGISGETLAASLKAMLKQPLPSFEGGYNGNQTPAVAMPYWKMGHPEWEPGVGAKWLEEKAAGRPALSKEELDAGVVAAQARAQAGAVAAAQQSPSGVAGVNGNMPYKVWTNYGNQMITPDGHGGDSGHPYKLTTEQGQAILQSYQAEQAQNPNITGHYQNVMPDEFNPNSPYYDPRGLNRTTPTSNTEIFQQAMARIQAMFHPLHPATGNVGQTTSSRPDWYQPGETMGFPSQAAFYASNPDWVPGTGAQWLKNKQMQDTVNYLPGNYPDPGAIYTDSQGNVSRYASQADFERVHGGPNNQPEGASSNSAINSIQSGIGTQQALTNGYTRGIISATNSIVPPAASTAGAASSSSSSRFGNVSVSVNVSGGSSSRLQQILNQSAQAFARSLATKDLGLV